MLLCFCFPHPPRMCHKWARSPVRNSSWCITAENAFLNVYALKERTQEGRTRERLKIMTENALLSWVELDDMESPLKKTAFSCTLPYITLVFSSHDHVLSVVPSFIMPQMITMLLTRLRMGSYFMDVCAKVILFSIHSEIYDFCSVNKLKQKVCFSRVVVGSENNAVDLLNESNRYVTLSGVLCFCFRSLLSQQEMG
jgi:hypothetical protein